MTLKDVLEIVAIPLVLAILAVAWPWIQSFNRRHAFENLILRELEEIDPFPKGAQEIKPDSKDSQEIGWWTHQRKDFIHPKIFKEASKNRDFILSLDPELVYFVTQLWDAKVKKNEANWLNFLKELSIPKYDKKGKIDEARKKWVILCAEYDAEN